MKRNYVFLLIFISILGINNISYWDNEEIVSNEINPIINFGSWEIIQDNKNVNLKREEVFKFFWDNINKIIPESYKYIDLKFVDVKNTDWNDLYDSLQKLVYFDLIKNLPVKINKDSDFNAYGFYKLAEKVFWTIILDGTQKEALLKRNVVKDDLDKVIKYSQEAILKQNKELLTEQTNNYKLQEKKEIFKDVYSTLLKEHYDKDKIDEVKYVEWAIEWLTNSIWDKFTVYFPPTESKDFYDALSWEYEWIWSYVDMETPWVLKIVTPIAWTPSEKAWLKGWDIVLKIDWKEIKKENSISEVISWIKWPAWTKVILTINRDWKISDIEVIRDKITVKDVEYKNLSDDTFYIQIRSFWDHVLTDFKKSLEELKTKSNVKKVIIDLRNNGWGYLASVTDMLWYFVPKDEPTAVVKYIWNDETSYSMWYDLIDFNKYKLIILQNSWTASASEIMIWTIKDYFKNSVIIWENSYWKWSVQTIRAYRDWSSLKYTIAKWFTWKTQTWIDKVWIKPDIELELNIEDFKKWIDNQLDKAKSL